MKARWLSLGFTSALLAAECLLLARMGGAAAQKGDGANHMLQRNTLPKYGGDTTLLMWLALLVTAAVVVLCIAMLLSGEHKATKK